jgi:hypothetical protein
LEYHIMDLGRVTGFAIGKNKEGDKDVVLLQVEVSDEFDMQTIELMTNQGQDERPPDDSFVLALDLGDAYKLAIAVDDGIEPDPTIEKGEKEIYSSDSGTRKAKIRLLKTGTTKINGGGVSISRVGDTVSVNLTAIDIQTLAAALLTTGAFTPSGSPPVPGIPVSYPTAGQITTGSPSVEGPND